MAVDSVDIYVGSRIRELRQRYYVTQKLLAEHLGLTYQQLQRYETGINRVSCSCLHRIARFFNVSASYFFPDYEADSLAIPVVPAQIVAEEIAQIQAVLDRLNLRMSHAQ